MSQLEKTELIRQKEMRIADLEKEITTKRRTIKSLRTRLLKLQASIKDMQRIISSKMSSYLEKLLAIKEEMKEVLKKVLKHKKIVKNQELRKEVQFMYDAMIAGEEDIIDHFGPEGEFAGFNPEDFADEDGNARKNDPFGQFRPEVSKEEQRSHRKIYLKLSQAFHPDRARNEEEAQRNHLMMQQITEAYQKNDIETLLSMERQFLGEEFDPASLDLADRPNRLDSQIEKLENELNFLTQQQQRLSQEIKNTRTSELGQALTEYERDNRNGYGFEAEVYEMEQELESLTTIKDAFEGAYKAGKMTPELEAMLRPPEIDPSDIMEGLLAGNMSPTDLVGLEDLLHFRDTSSVEPSYAAGDVVTLPSGALHEYDQIKPGTRFQVLQVYVDPVYMDIEYGLLPEVEYMASLPDIVFHDWLEETVILPVFWMDEEDIITLPKRKQKNFNTQEAIAVGRQRLYSILFASNQALFPPDRVERLTRILLSKPELSDEDCWLNFLEENPLPVNLYGKIAPNPFKPSPKKTVQIVGINEYDKSAGIILAFKLGHRFELIPLNYFDPKSPSPAFSTWLEDYKAWGIWRLDFVL